MKQVVFERRNQSFWDSYDQLVTAIEKGKQADYEAFVPAYRQLCQHIAVARHRGYSPHLIEFLNHLNWRGHQILYHRKSVTFSGIAKFIRYDFPQSVRDHASFFWVASLLMYLPSILMIALILWQPEWVYYLLDSHQIAQFEAMYDPTAEHIGRAREADSNVAMFGFYIQNNISVAFRTFATGLAVTLGSLFFLVFNGVYFGAVAGHLTEIGYSDTFWTFVIAHSSFEVTAIVLAGAAGIKLGFSLLSPGQLPRLNSLKKSAQAIVPILYGMIGMLVIAAFLEAFWSSNSALPVTVKYAVGAVMWLIVILYLTFSGRNHEPR